MADSTVGALTAASALTGTELFYGVQSANDVKVTAAQIATFTGGGGGSMAIGGAVTGATLGSVLFAGTAGVLAQDNTNFFFNDTTNDLKIGGGYYIQAFKATYVVQNASGDNWFEGDAGNLALTGHNNFGTGTGSLQYITTGSDNVGLGAFALQNLETGNGNFAVGSSALHNNINGNANTAIGIRALGNLNTSAGGYSNNVALGLNAGLTADSTQNSIFIGTQAGLSLTTSTNNSLIGFQSGSSLVTGDRNTVVGSSSWFSATSGTNNTMVGFGAGNNLDGGNYNTLLGMWRGPASTSISRVIALSDGTPTGNLNLDYNFTRAQVWSFNYDQYWGNPVGLHVYNMQDPGASPANYERAILDWNVTANVFRVGTQKGGTGTIRLTAIDGFAKAGAPAVGDLPSGSFALIDDTSGGQTWLVFNKAGTIRKVQLT